MRLSEHLTCPDYSLLNHNLTPLGRYRGAIRHLDTIACFLLGIALCLMSHPNFRCV